MHWLHTRSTAELLQVIIVVSCQSSLQTCTVLSNAIGQSCCFAVEPVDKQVCTDQNSNQARITNALTAPDLDHERQIRGSLCVY